MAELLLLPQQRAATERQQREPAAAAQVFALPGWVSELLKFHGTAYRENRILEVLAVQQGIWRACRRGQLQYLAPLAEFSGLAQDLHWLYQQLSLGTVRSADLPLDAQDEVAQLYAQYLEQLQQWQVMDAGSQAQRALDVVDHWCTAKEIHTVRTGELLDLPPVYEALLQRAVQGREWVQETLAPQAAVDVVAYASPTAEVEGTALRIGQALAAGSEPKGMAVVLADGSTYLPLVQQVFQRMQLPWQPPAPTLAAVPLGRAVLALLSAVDAEISKEHWQRLAAPGWGWPWVLDGASLRLLRLSPAVKGLPRWRAYLGADDDWAERLEEVAAWSETAAAGRTMPEHISWLRGILSQYLPDTWYTPDEERWGQLLQAWDVLHGILDALETASEPVAWPQFRRLLEQLISQAPLANRRQFRQMLFVGSPEQVLGLEYERIFALGFTEGTFPRRRAEHWLAGSWQQTADEVTWQQLLAVTPKLTASYPLEDGDGRSQVRSPVLEPYNGSRHQLRTTYAPRSRAVVMGSGELTDRRVIQAIQQRLLQRPQSVTRLNTYLACPYQYYCQQVLQLQEDEEISEDLTPLDEGTAVHSILQRFWEAFGQGPRPSVNRAQEWIERAAKDEEARLGKPLSQLLLRRLKQFIRWDLETLPETYRPQFLEETFQELTVEVDGHSIRLQGKIDRVDVNAQDQTCVILDYKTGSNPAAKDIRAGVHLQLPVYFLAARMLWPQLTPVGTAFYSIKDRKRAGLWQKPHHQSFAVGGSSNTLAMEEWEAVTADFIVHLQNCLRGILAGQFPIEPRTPQICGYCPYNGVCRKEVR